MFYTVIETLRVITALFIVVLIVSSSVYFLKRLRWCKQYEYSTWEIEKLREHIFKVLDRKKYEISEYRPFNNYQVFVYSANPLSKIFYVLSGVFLLLIGIVPGIICFKLGRSRLVITLKQSKEDLILLESDMKGRNWDAVWTKIYVLLLQKKAFVESWD